MSAWRFAMASAGAVAYATVSFWVATKFGDGTLEHLGIKVESERFHVPGLFSSQQVSGAPQLKIQCCDPKPSAQIREFPNRRQTPSGNRG